jgi:hypothetical protein
MGTGKNDKRLTKHLTEEWALRRAPSCLEKMRLHAYQMIECYLCQGMMEIMIYGL